MRTVLVDLWDKLRTSLWFIPTVMAGAAALLAFLLVRAQDWIDNDWMLRTRWLASGDPDGARQILATIAGSVITVTGVIFSVTIVALSLASQQFGPRLLRNFMRDRGNQIVLGTFIGTFLYAMLVLRVVHEPGSDDDEIPYLAVTFAVILAVAAMGVLIYFIHHVVVSIQADAVILNVSRELRRTMRELYDRNGDERRGEEESTNDAPPDPPEESGRLVHSTRTGYVRAINAESLMEAAEEHDVVVRVIERPGKFVVKDQPIAIAYGGGAHERAARTSIDDRILRCTFIGPTRSADQDIEFSIAQLVEIAVRSLSPSLNDPFTAMTCLDRLCEGLAELGQRSLPTTERCFCNGRLRLIIDRPSYEGMVDLAFNQIRQNSRRSPAVTIRLLEVIGLLIARLHKRRECIAPLLRHARMIASVSETDVPEEGDREVIKQRFEMVTQAAHEA